MQCRDPCSTDLFTDHIPNEIPTQFGRLALSLFPPLSRREERAERPQPGRVVGGVQELAGHGRQRHVAARGCLERHLSQNLHFQDTGAGRAHRLPLAGVVL